MKDKDYNAKVKSLERNKKTLSRRQLKSWGVSTKHAQRPDLLGTKHKALRNKMGRDYELEEESKHRK